MKALLARLEPVPIDAQARDLGFECLPGNSKLGRRPGGTCDPTTAGGERRINHFLFPIPIQSSEAFPLPALPGRWRRQGSFQPRLVDGERVAVAENDGSLDDILQLSNVAGPVVGLEQFHRSAVNRSDLLGFSSRIAVDEIFDEQGNVTRA